jgi:hypothetical protein
MGIMSRKPLLHLKHGTLGKYARSNNSSSGRIRKHFLLHKGVKNLKLGVMMGLYIVVHEAHR